ncbi:MAG: hypothetical protein ACTMHH_05090 [Nesterenkonia sp.]
MVKGRSAQFAATPPIGVDDLLVGQANKLGGAQMLPVCVSVSSAGRGSQSVERVLHLGKGWAVVGTHEYSWGLDLMAVFIIRGRSRARSSAGNITEGELLLTTAARRASVSAIAWATHASAGVLGMGILGG